MGARSIYVYATHGIFSDPNFYENLEKSALTFAFISDSLLPPNAEKEKNSKVRRLSMKELIVEFIQKTFN